MSNFELPLSGDIHQSINPWELWIKTLSVQTGFINIKNVHSSNPELEQNIIQNVASYGQQLNLVHQAMLVLIKNLPTELNHEDKQAVANYTAMQQRIEKAKLGKANKEDLLDEVDSVIRKLNKIKRSHPDEYLLAKQKLTTLMQSD